MLSCPQAPYIRRKMQSESASAVGIFSTEATSTKSDGAPSLDKESLLRCRRLRIGHNVALNYKDAPLLIMRGEGQWLYDEAGAPYLDCVNNVSHLGHCHPAFVTAVQQQVGTLHTNSRYLHPAILTYAQELSATLPPPPLPHHAATAAAGQGQGQDRQWVMYWVNSGSEANDLALRLARAHTGRTGVICVEGAYHGHTLSVLDVSPYKYDIEGGEGRARHIREATLPCMDTGKYRRGRGGKGDGGSLSERDCARLYAAEVAALCAELAAQEQADEDMGRKLQQAIAALQQAQASAAALPFTKRSESLDVGDPTPSSSSSPSSSLCAPPASPSPTPALPACGSRACSPVASVASSGYGSGSETGVGGGGSCVPAARQARASPHHTQAGTPRPPSAPAHAQSQVAQGTPAGMDASMLQWAVEALTARCRPTEGSEEGCRAGLAAFISESVLSCGGQVMPPRGYFAQVYSAVRAAGGVCIADEVQVGFGRVGTAMWGFQLGQQEAQHGEVDGEAQEAVPDILTLGKPMGNGFPVAAVLCTPEIAASFAAYRGGQEYFATYGGNPVAGTVALAVLRTLQAEGLQAHAGRVGEVLLQGFRQLQAEFPCTIGSVRGCGLMVGLEILQRHSVAGLSSLPPVTGPTRHAHPAVYSHGHACAEAGCPVTAVGLPCPGDRWPAPALASAIKYAALAPPWRMLLSTDGMADNIIKLKPPMCFTEDNAREVTAALREIMAGMGCT